MEITKSFTDERARALIGGDYAAYHAQTTRRIHTLRKKLKLTTPKGRKYTSRPAVTSEDIGKNVLYVPLLLTCAERAWADAMHMKSSQSPENTQKPLSGATKRQITSRFRRAVTYAETLVQALQDQSVSQASDRNVLEARAYLCLLKGGLNFERNNWPSCIQNYSFVRLVYTALSNQAEAETFQDLLDGTIDPSLRYAAYQQKLPRTKAVSDIAIENFPADDADARQKLSDIDITAFETSAEKAAAQAQGAGGDLPSTIQWRGRTVQLEDASISQALAISVQKEAALAQTYSSHQDGTITAKDLAVAYDDIINATQDAADATKLAIDEMVAEGVDPADNRVQSLQITRTAVNYNVIQWRVGRNRVLCGPSDGVTFESAKASKARREGEITAVKVEPTGRKMARLREQTALYDSILQNIDAAKQLPGVAADIEFLTTLNNGRSYFRALKCIAIGRSHAINGHINNALALFARAQELSSSVKPSVSEADKTKLPKLDLAPQQLNALQTHAEALTLQYRALADLNQSADSHQSKSHAQLYKAPLLHRLHLDQYDDQVDLKNIVNYPPTINAIPMQPMFLDIAFDNINYPHTGQATTESASVSTDATQAAEEAPKKRGWFGFGR